MSLTKRLSFPTHFPRVSIDGQLSDLSSCHPKNSNSRVLVPTIALFTRSVLFRRRARMRKARFSRNFLCYVRYERRCALQRWLYFLVASRRPRRAVSSNIDLGDGDKYTGAFCEVHHHFGGSRVTPDVRISFKPVHGFICSRNIGARSFPTFAFASPRRPSRIA